MRRLILLTASLVAVVSLIGSLRTEQNHQGPGKLARRERGPMGAEGVASTRVASPVVRVRLVVPERRKAHDISDQVSPELLIDCAPEQPKSQAILDDKTTVTEKHRRRRYAAKPPRDLIRTHWVARRDLRLAHYPAHEVITDAQERVRNPYVLAHGVRRISRSVSENAGGQARFELRTTAFSAGGNIPVKFTCDGPDVSPPLEWGDPPPGTQSFTLIADDPDAPAGTWVHWVVYNLPADSRQLPEGLPKRKEIKGGGWQGLNDFGKVGYGGPCPPPGKPHRYFFVLYALRTKLNLKEEATRKDVEEAMKGQSLARAELMGRFGH